MKPVVPCCSQAPARRPAYAGTPIGSTAPIDSRNTTAQNSGRDRQDAGFTLVEVVVSIVLIGTLMTALTTFFVSTVSVTNAQGARQAAIRIAEDAMEWVRALPGSALIAGRTSMAVSQQWASAIDTVDPHLASMVQVYDQTIDPPPQAVLPTTAQDVEPSINGRDYDRSWYVGRCWQPRGLNTTNTQTSENNCTRSSGPVAFFKVVVAVTWTARCAGPCSYITTTLVRAAWDQPVFRPSVT